MEVGEDHGAKSESIHHLRGDLSPKLPEQDFNFLYKNQILKFSKYVEKLFLCSQGVLMKENNLF